MRPGGLAAKARYGVFLFDGQWLLCCERHRLGRYKDMETAVLAGRHAACHAMGSGFAAELYVVDLGGEVRRADLT